MLVRCGNQEHKIIIDGGSSMNVVKASMVGRSELPVEPQSHLSKVAWIDSTSILVTQHHLIYIYIYWVEFTVIPYGVM